MFEILGVFTIFKKVQICLSDLNVENLRKRRSNRSGLIHISDMRHRWVSINIQRCENVMHYVAASLAKSSLNEMIPVELTQLS